MKPVFIDFHIHTSEDPEKLNGSYDLDTLKNKIEDIAEGAEYLISLTDHNTINKSVYLRAVQKFEHLILGVELHVRNHDEARPYHCHILFNLENINEASIDDINAKLDVLYPNKVIAHDDQSIPKLQAIMDCFDNYEFLLLPHGGQNHAKFDGSIQEGVEFDKTLERSIYYNYFDGFTARSNKSLEKTVSYFERLGIADFVNLVTATDNYEPKKYPDCKAGRDASDFIPTWMLASPTFNGLRLSLSESSRLEYGSKPDSWAECIEEVSLQNDTIDISATLTPGLNVVIGGSSSGKSLFVDSIYRKITGDYERPLYTAYGAQDIEVINRSGLHPHYLDQNYIGKICDPNNAEDSIEHITILKSIFPSDREEREKIVYALSELGTQLSALVQAVQEIEKLQDTLNRIPFLSRLILTETIQRNPLKYILPSEALIEAIEYGETKYKTDCKMLDQLDVRLTANPLVDHDGDLVRKLKDELSIAYNASKTEALIRDGIEKYEEKIDQLQEDENQETTTKRNEFEKLRRAIRNYLKYQKVFQESLAAISMFKTSATTKTVEAMGHKLFIRNEFELTKDKFLSVVNKMLKSKNQIEKFEDISPETLFKIGFSGKGPKVSSYDDFERLVKKEFEGMNKKKYQIITSEDKDFDTLSAGWKTSVILDLVLGAGADNAPLIIDQPEDNLATGYINSGLLKAIKACKNKKQIILVSHNATIPMLGDAQNIVICNNSDNFITIRSSLLEGEFESINTVDWIAKLTDGGKSSIKKRVKKYNLKSFRGENETGI